MSDWNRLMARSLAIAMVAFFASFARSAVPAGAIPDKIDVDITDLGAHQQVRISDLKLPEGVKVEEDPHRVIVGVTTARAEVVAEVAAVEGAAVAAEPELVKKGKTETEE